LKVGCGTGAMLRALAYAYPEHEFGRKMDAALAAATFNNPFVLRDMATVVAADGATAQGDLA